MNVSWGYRKKGFDAYGEGLLTQEAMALFQANDVLLRGDFNAVAERLARQYHLRFLHLDVELASVGDYFARGNNTITLRFRSDGSAYVHQDCRCQGISASSMGGGENSFDIASDFYRTMTPQELADMCWGSCYREMLENGKLAAFMQTAQAKGGYFLDFRG